LVALDLRVLTFFLCIRLRPEILCDRHDATPWQR